MHLGHGHVESHGDIFAVLDDDAHVARGLLPRLAGAIDVPTAAHEQMSSKDAAAGEVNQHPFAARFDLVHELAR